MAVTKATYTATATWTASQLADVFKQAFIGAGLMTDWYDSFLNTVENRVLQVVHDSGKTYGTVYYWFMFTTGGVFIHTALGWNATTHVPTGTQYLDYFATTTNATTNHRSLVSLAAATTVSLTRYTSAVNSGCSWFVLRNGSTYQPFMLPSPTMGPSALIDQNKMAFNGMLYTINNFSSAYTYLDFVHGACHLRRTYLGATVLRGTTGYTYTPYVYRYFAQGNSTSVTTNYSNSSSLVGVVLPTAHANTQSALASDHTPVFTSPTVSPYMAALPSDFGVASYYASNAMAVQDTLVVSSGSEEWEMLTVCSNATTDAGRLLLLARTV
jgi:hypothetical protein